MANLTVGSDADSDGVAHRQRWVDRQRRTIAAAREQAPRRRSIPGSSAAAGHAQVWGERHWTSRLLHGLGAIAAHSAAGSVALGLPVGWALVGVATGFPDWWSDIIYVVTGSVTFVMVFVIQHTQERQTSATQRKLDELIRSSIGADNTLIAVEEASDEHLQALTHLNLADRQRAADDIDATGDTSRDQRSDVPGPADRDAVVQRIDTTIEAVGPHVPCTSKAGWLGRVDLAQQRIRGLAVAVSVVRKSSDDGAGQRAALIAYYGFFSVFPALLALVTILGFVLEGDPQLRQRIADSALAQFPIIGNSIAASVSSPLAGNQVALIVGLVGAIWAGLGMMQAAQDAMNHVWDVARVDFPGFVGKRVRSLLMLLVVATMLIVSTGTSQLAARLPSGYGVAALLFVIGVTLDVALFAVVYRLLTAARPSWRAVAPGALVVGLAYVVLQLIGGLYVDRTLRGATATYGAFAVVIGLLAWIYLIAQVLVLGAELNVVLDRGLWPRSLFAEPVTAADRRSHAVQAEKQRMDENMSVLVHFDARSGLPPRHDG